MKDRRLEARTTKDRRLEAGRGFEESGLLVGVLAAILVLALGGCGEPTPEPVEANRRGNDKLSVSEQAVPANPANNETSDPSSDEVPEAPDLIVSDAWTPALEVAAAAMPGKHRISEPLPGRWIDDGFKAGAGDGLPAVRALYRTAESAFIKPIGDGEDLLQAEIGKIAFEQTAEFIAIVAGDERLRGIHEKATERLDTDGWKRSRNILIEAGHIVELEFWRRGLITLYLHQTGGLLLYAIEKDGESEVGGGHGTSFGSQQIVLFLDAYKK